MEQQRPDIRTWSLEQLTDWAEQQGEKPFRAKQVYEWLWKKSAVDFDAMTNLSKDLRERLKDQFDLLPVTLAEKQVSEDFTIKNAFRLHDGSVVEGVLIPTNSRMTACISSQVGCSLSCAFCATGRLKRLRNLTGAEIYDQVVAIDQQAREDYGHHLTNIVYMGMGEPLMNYKGVQDSVEKLTSPQGLDLSPKRITISTAGIARMIKRMADDDMRCNLALSLHAANDAKRSEIMPINDSNNLEALAEALLYFLERARGSLTYEYIIFRDFNDSIQDARELARFCKRVPAKVNIIEYNPIDDGRFERAELEKVDAFASFLESQGVQVNIRRSRGKDIDAACGQLANKNQVASQE